MHPIATTVNRAEAIREVRSCPKFRSPIERPDRIIVKFSQERKVRSLAKNTLGSMRVGREIRFVVVVGGRRGAVDIFGRLVGGVRGMETVETAVGGGRGCVSCEVEVDWRIELVEGGL